MLVTEKKKIFIDIPIELEKDLELEILSLYKNLARDHVVPCIEELTKVLGYFNTLLGFYEETGMTSLEDVEKFSIFLATYVETDNYVETFFRLHKNVEYYFKVNGYFFERNWLFSMMPMHYDSKFINQPIVNVW